MCNRFQEITLSKCEQLSNYDASDTPIYLPDQISSRMFYFEAICIDCKRLGGFTEVVAPFLSVPKSANSFVN